MQQQEIHKQKKCCNVLKCPMSPRSSSHAHRVWCGTSSRNDFSPRAVCLFEKKRRDSRESADSCDDSCCQFPGMKLRTERAAARMPQRNELLVAAERQTLRTLGRNIASERGNSFSASASASAASSSSSSEKYRITESALGGQSRPRTIHLIRVWQCREICTHSASPFLCAVAVLHQQHQRTYCLCFRFLSPCSRMSSTIFWSGACRSALNRPLLALLEALYACCGATVTRPPLLPLGACPAHVCVAGCLVCV
jgi:hypothetical protein